MSNLELTYDQNIIYNELIKFVESDKEKELLLIGYAGTGKTTLVAKFIGDLIKKKICKKIVMAAPTHKAVNIAKSKLYNSEKDSEEFTKIINIMTVHRLLNYQSYIGMEGEKYFAKGKVDPNWSIYNLIVVDECSMLSNQIISDIKIQIKKESNINIKIIYVGDPAQLPPVNQGDSKIFNDTIRKLTLDKIIRTSNQQIMELSNSHRKWIFSKMNEDIPHVGEYECDSIRLYSVENKEINNWLDDFINLLQTNNNNISDLDDGIDIIIDKTNNLEIENYNNNIILTWTNKKSNIYNQYIREKIFNKKNLSQWEIGEILIFNDFHRKEIYFNNQDNLEKETNTDIDDSEKEIKIDVINFYTSEQVKLFDIKKIKYKFTKLKFKINNDLTPELNNKFKKYYNKINNEIDFELDIYEMKIKKIVDLLESKEIIPEYTIFSIYKN